MQLYETKFIVTGVVIQDVFSGLSLDVFNLLYVFD